jgi:D-alanine--poly(phosphoribitol) ligase subunit 2
MFVMKMEEAKIIEALCEICGAEPEDLEGDMELFEEGLLDSFGVISLFVELESIFGVKLDPTEVERSVISTPDKLVAFVLEKL